MPVMTLLENAQAEPAPVLDPAIPLAEPVNGAGPKVFLPIDTIDEPPQVRKFIDEDFIDRLAATVRLRGQTWPIKVRRGSTPGRVDLVAGGQRLRAFQRAGLRDVWVVEVDGEMTEADVLEEQLQENGLRTQLRPCEEGEAMERLRKLRGLKTEKDLAQALGFTLTHVSRGLTLLKKYPPAYRARIDKGDVPDTVADEIAKLENKADRLAMFDNAVEEGWTKEQAIAKLSALRTPGKPRGATASRATKVRLPVGKEGAAILISGPPDLELTAEIVADYLDCAAKRAKQILSKNPDIQAAALPAEFQKPENQGGKAKGRKTHTNGEATLPVATADSQADLHGANGRTETF